MPLRRLAPYFAACALVLACAPAPEPVAPVAPEAPSIMPSVVAPAASSMSLLLPPPAPKPVASAAPLDWAKVTSWTDPAAVAALAIDCKVGTRLTDPGGAANPLACDGEAFEQSCAPDLCFDGTSACRSDCDKACAPCDAGCVTSCEACKAPCTDDACRTACATTCGACRQACLATRDACSTGTCGARDKACRKDVVTKAKACGFARQCAKLGACTDAIDKTCKGSKDPACFDKAQAKCFALIAPCPAEYASICSFAGPKYFDANQ